MKAHNSKQLSSTLEMIAPLDSFHGHLSQAPVYPLPLSQILTDFLSYNDWHFSPPRELHDQSTYVIAEEKWR